MRPRTTGAVGVAPGAPLVGPFALAGRRSSASAATALHPGSHEQRCPHRAPRPAPAPRRRSWRRHAALGDPGPGGGATATTAGAAPLEIEALLVRIARGAEISQPPLADRARRIAAGVQQFGKRHRFIGNRILPDKPRPSRASDRAFRVFVFAIVANI